MTLAVVIALLVLAVSVAWAVGGRLQGAVWTRSSPGVALFVWHCLAVSLASSLFAVVALTTHDTLEHVMLAVPGTQKSQLHAIYAGHFTVGGPWNITAVAMLVLVLAVVVSAVRTVMSRPGAMLAHHAQTSDVVETTHGTISVVRHDDPFAYCVPRRRGRPARIFVSSGAAARLEVAELDSVVLHEQAHLTRRHHLHVLVAEVLVRALRPLRVLSSYADEVRRLVELQADDIACRRTTRRTLASALLTMAAPPSRVGLAAAATPTGERVERLIGAPAQGDRFSLLMAVLAGCAAAAPSLAVVTPALWLVLQA